jgi:NADPH-dependent curcumin reductase CurA
VTDNHQVRLAARPQGLPTAGDWAHTTEPVPEPGDGRFVVRVTHLSLDPAMRGWMNEGRSYIPPVGLGEVMRAQGAGVVTASKHPDFPQGAVVTGTFGVQEHAESDGRGVLVVDPDAAPVPTHLALLGTTGLTAYFGLFDVGALRDGETVVVSGPRARWAASSGSWRRSAGAGWSASPGAGEVRVDRRRARLRRGRRPPLGERPEGAAHPRPGRGRRLLRQRRRRDPRRGAGPAAPRRPRRDLRGDQHLQRHRAPARPGQLPVAAGQPARMEGFVVFDFADRYAEAAAAMARWLGEGKLRSREDVVRGGVADFPEVFLRLFRGDNTGKLVLQIAD